jgi:SAM-dependent methyltransferase
MNKVDFDAFAHSYDDLLREHTGFFSEDESYFARYKVAIAKRALAAVPRRILEFGCGTGRNIPFLKEAFPEATVMGCDVSRKSLEIAVASNPGVRFWKEGEGESEEAGFDLIFVAGVFHHIPPAERDAAAATLSRRLSAGGMLVVFEHNPFNPVTRRIVSNCPYDEGVVLLTPRELRRHLEAAGLRVVKRAYALFVPPAWTLLQPLESRLGWLPMGGQYWVSAEAA